MFRILICVHIKKLTNAYFDVVITLLHDVQPLKLHMFNVANLVYLMI